MEDDLNFQEMEDDINFSGNGRWPLFFRKLKTTSIFHEMEDDLNFSRNGRRPQFQEMEENFNFSGNGRRPQFFGKWKTTSIFHEMEDNLNFSGNRRQLKFSENGRPPQFNISWYQIFLSYFYWLMLIKNNLQINQSQPSLTWAWHSSAPACFRFFPTGCTKGWG